MNKIQISKICDTFHLGKVLSDATPVSGGLIHRMWRINTSQGSYAIKELDATIMKRPGIYESYIQSEQIATLLKGKQIPAATALFLNQTTPLYEVDGIIVMVFAWVDGKILTLKQVTTEHAKQIGAILATIHTANIKPMDLFIPEVHLIPEEQWYSLVSKAISKKLSWAVAANTNLPNLITWSNAYQEAKLRLNRRLVISHTDMDPKNVLWCDDTSPVLIDWEGAGLINPTAEVINVALEWAGMTDDLFKESIFLAVIEGYCNHGGSVIESDVYDALYGLIGGCLGWLEFNMCRSLDSTKFDVKAQKLGLEETEMTLTKLHFLAANIERFIQLIQ